MWLSPQASPLLADVHILYLGQYPCKALRPSPHILHEISPSILKHTSTHSGMSQAIHMSHTRFYRGFEGWLILSPPIFLLTLKLSVHSILSNFSMSKTDRKILSVPSNTPALPLTTHLWSPQKQFFVFTTLSQTTFMRHVYEPRATLVEGKAVVN